MYQGKTVSLIIPAHNEEDTIAGVVSDYRADPLPDEILVVANNCSDRTTELATAAGARVIQETRPGYGAALSAGMDAATGDILVLTEADGSFQARDLKKLLPYLEDASMVVGTRTTRQMLEQGANMRFLLRWGNVAMAKWLEFLWYFKHEPRFTDVGCTYRALTRECWAKIRGSMTASGPAFSPEMMCEALIKGHRVIEVPVSYHPRLGGESKHSGTWWKLTKVAWRMFRIINRKRLLGR
jgi:glycosyltransferase involved in cell wall biosynthesis